MRNRFITLFIRSVACVATAGTIAMLANCGGETGSSDEENIGESREELLSAANCPAGYQVVVGTAGNDVINVSVSPNPYNVNPALPICIMGLGGNDTITSGSAADFIGGGSGNDNIHGGGGDDQIYGETGDDTMFGDDGNDLINGDDGNDTSNGGNGADHIVDGRGNDIIHGNAGNDWLQSGADDDQVFGDDGDDTIDAGGGNNTLWGGTGNDLMQVTTSFGVNTFHGEDGNDNIQGGSWIDTIEGGNGNDTITGNAADDIIWGDFINNATATTGTSVDTIHGNDGADNIHGGPGNDILYGDVGNDTISGDDGDDRIIGGTAGTKTITGGNGNDLEKGSGTGTANGDANNDVIVSGGSPLGGVGTDACSGGTANSCELNEPAAFCTSSAQCSAGQRCATEVGVCIYCQSDSECSGGKTCVPTVGCNTKETVCNDGIDNDGDGLTDCLDTADCQTDPICQPGVKYFGNGGVNHDCIVNAAGVVKCWGRDNCSQLGYFSNPYSATPKAITFTLAGPPKLVRGGSLHTCVLLTNGTVQCFGGNSAGQLGNGTTSAGACSTTATTVTGLSNVSQLATGGNFNCAVVNGAVQCWGENNWGQLGNNTQTNSSVPVAVQGISGTVIEVKTGTQNACAVLTNGAVQCWGRNQWGQLGDGTTVNPRLTARNFLGGPALQVDVAGEFTCIRVAGGRVYCSGVNYAGQLGQGTVDSNPHPTPVQVNNITDASDIALGWYHACIIRAGGQGMKCWGQNTFGQVGNGVTSAAVTTPVLIPVYNATNVSAGQEYTCVRHVDGSLGCWGRNQFGQLGDGTTTQRNSQVSVIGAP